MLVVFAGLGLLVILLVLLIAVAFENLLTRESLPSDLIGHRLLLSQDLEVGTVRDGVAAS